MYILLVPMQVCTTGYIASKSIKDESKSELSIKRLLYTDYIRGGKGDSVLLLFKAPQNVKVSTIVCVCVIAVEGGERGGLGKDIIHVVVAVDTFIHVRCTCTCTCMYTYLYLCVNVHASSFTIHIVLHRTCTTSTYK